MIINPGMPGPFGLTFSAMGSFVGMQVLVTEKVE
jgi:hypothetical protein